MARGGDDVPLLRYCAAVLIGYVVLDLLRLAAGRRGTVRLAPDGLTYRKPWWGTVTCEWHEIETVRADGNLMWGAIFTWVKIQGRRGRLRIATAALQVDGDELAFGIRDAARQCGAEVHHENPDKDWD